MRRTDTANQRRSNAAYQQANPLLPLNRSKQKQRAFDAATEYFKRYSNPLNDTLRDVFGVEFFGRAALWLDPLSDFRNSAGIISGYTRYREKVGFEHVGKYVEHISSEFSDNRVDDNPNPVGRFITDQTEEDLAPVINDNATRWYSTMWDSTYSSRSWEVSYGSDEKYDRAIPSFGILSMHNIKSEDYLTPNVIFRQDRSESHYSRDNYDFFEMGLFHHALAIDGSCTSPSGAVFVDDIEVLALDLMNENISSVLPSALASKRSFNLAYQIAELEDLPRLLRDIGNLQHLLQSYIKDPAKKFSQIDKDIASLNLAWEFGVKSLVSAAEGLMKLPTRATKRLNYLIGRNGKVSTGRSSRGFKHEFEQGLPTFEFVLPDWITVSNEVIKRDVDIELRCVVNQTIQFPKLAVPSLVDFDFLRLIGAVPQASDYYNIIPFTWLFDWFGGLGAYIDIMDAIHSDRQLVNYGFMTIVITEVLSHSAELKVTSTFTKTKAGINPGDPSIVEEYTETEKVIPYLKTYTRKYQRRVDIGSLEGVKSFGFYQTNLSDFQSKILGSLLSQRA